MMKGASIFAAFGILAVAWWSFLGGDRLIPHRPTPREFPSRIQVVYHISDDEQYERERWVNVDAPGISDFFIHETSDGKSYVCQLTAVLLH